MTGKIVVIIQAYAENHFSFAAVPAKQLVKGAIGNTSNKTGIN